MKKKFLQTTVLLLGASLLFAFSPSKPKNTELKISPEALKDKIKGGWADQVIGVTFGCPTEFVYNGTYIQDYQTIPWYEGYVANTMEKSPGLFDDIYMD